MSTNSFSGKKSLGKENILSSKLVTKTINKIARSCGYLQRNTGGVSPKNLIIGYLLMISKQRNTYSDWAIEIGLLMGRTFTKQALNARMSPQTEIFIKQTVEKIICNQTPKKQTRKIRDVVKHFKSIKIDDSTTIALPEILSNEFPGNVSRGIKKAQAKIHAMYNLTENNFPFLNVHSFANNDQSLSSAVLPYLNQGDLCLRDLGFTVLNVISEFNQKGINFIARKIFLSKVYEVETESEINLLKELRRKKFVDREVLIGAKQKIKARLIALPISPEQAAERRRKAGSNRDYRLNHSSEYYALLGYSIYITNVKSEQCNAEEIYQLYKLRWRIEIIFKSWKSCFSLEKIIHSQCKNKVRVNCIIYLMLLYIYLFHVIWYQHYKSELANEHPKKYLSLLKMAQFFNKHFEVLFTLKSDKEINQQIKVHCAYDNRKDRENALQFQHKITA